MHGNVDSFLQLLFPAAILVPALVYVVWLTYTNRRLGRTWQLVMEGEYEYVVYGKYDCVRRTGSLHMQSSRNVTYTMQTTAIHFVDGRACVARGRLDMPYPKGTPIRVLKNGLGTYWVVKA